MALCTPVGLAAGLIGGGLLGALRHKNLGLDEADRERIGSELEGGKAAVGVLAPVSEATFVAGELADLGGTAELTLYPTRLSRKPRRPLQQTSPSWLHGRVNGACLTQLCIKAVDLDMPCR